MKKSLSLVRRIVPFLFSVLSVGLVGEAANARSKPPAAQAKRHIAVGGFSGPKSADARSAVLETLKAEDEYDVSDAADLAADGDDKSYAKAGRSLRVQAILTGTVKKGSTLVLSVHNGKDGALIQDVEIKGGTPAKLAKSINESLVISVADLIAQGKLPAKAHADEQEKTDEDAPAKAKSKDDDEDEDEKAEPKAKPKHDEDDDEAPPAEKPHRKAGPSVFEALVGVRGTRRSFDYQDTADQLRPNGGYPVPLTFLLPFGPAPFVDLTFYPLALSDSHSGAADIGLIAGGEFGIPLKVVLDSGGQTQLTTSTHMFYVGLRDRIRTGHHEFGVNAAFGQHAYSLKGDITPAPAFKDITYTFIKIGLDMRLVFGDVSLGAHAGTRIVISPGAIKNVFPHAKALALDAGLSGGYAVSDSVDLMVGVDILRYGLNFNPVDAASADTVEDGTPRIAGGAVDQYLSAWGGVRAHF